MGAANQPRNAALVMPMAIKRIKWILAAGCIVLSLSDIIGKGMSMHTDSKITNM